MRVLVTGAGALVGQGIIKSLRMSTLDVTIIAADPSPTATGLYRADRAYLIPLVTAPDYLEVVRRLIRAESINAVLVGTDVELPVFAHERERLERQFGCKVVVSSPKVVAIADDKWKTYLFLRENGFSHPATALSENATELAREIGFPLIVKPRVGARSVGVRVVRDEAELADAISRTETALVVQECLLPEESEYTVGTLTFGRRCDNVITMRRDIRDGNTLRAYVKDEPEVRESVRAIANCLGAEGPANFQLRKTVTGPKVFEINARFSGTTPFRAAMGWNEVEAVLRHEVLGEPSPALSFREGIVLRYWNEVVVEEAQFHTLADTGHLETPQSKVALDF